MEKAKVIEDAVSSIIPFHVLRYTDMTGMTVEITVYFSDPSYTIYAYSEGVQRVTGVTISAIEK